MANRFNTLAIANMSAADAVIPAHLRLVDDVISMPFQGDVVARAAYSVNPINSRPWLMRAVDVHLPEPTRRPFLVYAAISLQAVHGHALARITVDGHTTSRQIRAQSSPKVFDIGLHLAIRRSTYPRDRLRVLVWVEASCSLAGGEAQAQVDTIDIQAR